MYYGFLDESGAPGVTTRDNDYLTVSLVVFPDRDTVDKCSASIDRLRERLKLPDGYEFHHARNSTRPKTAFVKLLPNLEFRFITIAIRKNGSRIHASYPRMAEYLIREVAERFPDMMIEMDTNPVLNAELRRQAKIQGLGVKFKPTRSTNHNMIQLADYVVALSTRKLKGTAKAIEQYRPLIRKQIVFTEVTESRN